MALDSGGLLRTKALTSIELYGKKRSLANPRDYLASVGSGNNWKINSVPKILTSVYDLELHRCFKKMDGKILCRTLVQMYTLEACGLKTVLIGETCTNVSVTRK